MARPRPGYSMCFRASGGSEGGEVVRSGSGTAERTGHDESQMLRLKDARAKHMARRNGIHRRRGRHANAVATATKDKSGRLSENELAVALNELISLNPAGEGSGRRGSHVSRVSDGVVHPSSTEHRVLHGTDEPIITAMQRGTAIGQRHLQHGAITGSNEEGFDADLALWIIEPERGDADQTCAGISDKPRLDWRPALEKFKFGRAELGPVQKCHAPMLAAANGCEGSRSNPSCPELPL